MARPPADTLQSIELADGVEIHLSVAGPGARSVAWMIDLAIYLGILIGVLVLIGLLSGFVGESIGNGVFLLAMFLLSWFYNVFFEMSSKSATPGQRTMGLKVASVTGGPVRLPQSIIRNLLRIVDFMPGAYLFGLVCCLFTDRFQRLGDLVADTVVVYAEPKVKSTPPALINADAIAPPVALSWEEQAAVLQFLERAPNWSDARKLELSNLLTPLTKQDDMPGLTRLCGMGLWLQQRGSGSAAPNSAQQG